MIYDYQCKTCDIFFHVEAPMGDQPKWKKCPACGKRGYQSFSAPAIIFKGLGWESNSHRDKRRAVEGFDKDTARKFYEDSIKNSRERLKSGGEHYKNMITTPENLKAQGYNVKRLDSKNKKSKKKDLTRIAKDIKNKKDK